tara:strand:+ start:200 stop:850 length:651 start_codon:yes stop_codon:yes gene_type:complete
MEEKLDVQTLTQYSLSLDGKKRGTWRWDRGVSASKICPSCGLSFKPKMNGLMVVPMEYEWKRRIACSKSCAKKLNNPMSLEACRLKVSETLKRIGHKPKVRGGNGKGESVAQKTLRTALGVGWQSEYVQTTGMKTWMGARLPHHYKVDIVNVEKMIAIEVDGGSHGTRKRQEQDLRKTQVLTALGWRVLRVRNAEAERLSLILESQDILATLLMEY